jgi:hypothetical protein
MKSEEISMADESTRTEAANQRIKPGKMLDSNT